MGDSLTWGFMFDGVKANNYGIKVRDIRRPVTPPTKDMEIEVTGRDGTIDMGSTYDKLLIEVDCVLSADSPTDLRSQIRRVGAWLNAKKGERKLIFEDEADKFYLAKISGQIGLDQTVEHGFFTLMFKASQPFAFALAGSSQAAQITASGQSITITRAVDAAAVAPIITIVNNGASAVDGIKLVNTQQL